MTPLMRDALRPLYASARDAHPGLLIQRGYADCEGGSAETKTRHIERICRIPASDFYARAYARWKASTADRLRFQWQELKLQTRLFVGLSGGGMLETGCAIAHSYGVPYIPGSSVKGAVASYVRESAFGREHPQAAAELFGSSPTDEHPLGLSGLISFHDAWWVPGSAERPLVQEVVATHHLEYYGNEGEREASDLDSPVPNAQIAVQGAFLFVLECAGEPALAWMRLAQEMLVAALCDLGAGAKTRGGYGLFHDPSDPGPVRRTQTNDAPAAPGRRPPPAQEPSPPSTCPWVDDTLAALMQKNRAPLDDTLRGKGLAAAWQALPDPALKAQALAEIRARWERRGWWDAPPGGAARQARAIYGE